MSAFRRGRMVAPVLIPATTADFTNFTLDQTTDALEFIIQADEAATITQVGFRYGARTGTPPTYTVSVQGVGTTGNPDGPIKGGGSPASHAFIPPADTSWDGTFQWQTLDNSYTCTRGEWMAFVIANTAGTINASNCSSFSQHTRLNGTGVYGAPYSIANNAGTRARGGYGPLIAWKTASTTYGRPIANVSTVNIRNDTGVEAALSFNLPATWGSTFRVAGVYLSSAGLTAANSIRTQLYDTNGTTVLQTVSYDTDFAFNAGVNGINILFTETTLSTLNMGSTYRLGVFGLTSGVGALINVLDVPAAADMSAFWGGGPTYGYSSRSGGTGAWADLATRRPAMELILDDWTVAAAGGGSPIVGSPIVAGRQA